MRWQMEMDLKISAWLGGLFALVFVASSAIADVRADLIRLLREISEQTPTRAVLTALGYEGQKLELALRQSNVFMRDPAISGFIADRLIDANEGRLSPEFNGGGLVTPLIYRGLGHLPIAEMRQFYLIEHAILKAVPVRDCGRFVKNRISGDRWAELSSRAEAKMSLRTLKTYYRIQVKAARLGVVRKPVQLSEQEKEQIFTRVSGLIDEQLAGHDKARQLTQALNNRNRANNANACAAEKFLMGILLNLKGQELRHALLVLSAR